MALLTDISEDGIGYSRYLEEEAAFVAPSEAYFREVLELRSCFICADSVAIVDVHIPHLIRSGLRNASKHSSRARSSVIASWNSDLPNPAGRSASML